VDSRSARSPRVGHVPPQPRPQRLGADAKITRFPQPARPAADPA
jgi:hypothetical protein